jgi:hypothetical protein
VDVARADLRAGLPLRADFGHPDEGESYLIFRPAGRTSGRHRQEGGS